MATQLAAYPSAATHFSRRLYEQQATQALRQQIMGNYLDLPMDQLVFGKQDNGKPFLKNNVRVEFNQSHCNDQFVLAINQQGLALGVDIETKHRKINIQALAARILTPLEQKQFVLSDRPQEFLLKIWTVKEAVLKASGLGIRLNLHTLETGARCDGHGMAAQPLIGHWHYKCFETSQHYYTIAWQDIVAAVDFVQI
ncbi:4'-phosphopantetheinyl transferase family protein [Alkanindiges sp. WGS2144]|uniref:4'-phosphopantetheinyl transferase family protein n=1 Tax=Alkanindiges sp. WGS2144 TaxID=3366808 RepID=UPI003750E6B6